MQQVFTIIQVISAVLLIAAILMQQRGTGLGSAFGGGSEIYRTKRGVEKILFVSTIVLSVLFLASVFASVVWR